eukprot:g23202.t1
MASVVGLLAIVTSAKTYGKAIFFLLSEQAVHLAVEKGLTVGGTYLPVNPLEVIAQKIMISNIPPFIASQLLLPHYQSLGEIWSGVMLFLLGLKDPALKYVYSFRRQVFVCLAGE